jgi:hypothetical protein
MRVCPAAGHQPLMPRSSIRGLTEKADQVRRGSARLNADKNTRSASRSCGRRACRRKIESSCRSTRISSSFDSGDRQQRTITSNRRRTTKYASDHSTRGPPPDGEADATRPLPLCDPPDQVTEFSNPTRLRRHVSWGQLEAREDRNPFHVVTSSVRPLPVGSVTQKEKRARFSRAIDLREADSTFVRFTGRRSEVLPVVLLAEESPESLGTMRVPRLFVVTAENKGAPWQAGRRRRGR